MPMYKRSLLVLLFIAAAASIGLFISWSGRDETMPLNAPGSQAVLNETSSDEMRSASADAASEKADEITVYVSGEVNAPGLITLSADSRVGHAVEACGGFTPLSDKASVNLAQKLTDGMHVNISSLQDNEPAANTAVNGSQTGSLSDGSVNINTASREALDTLPGIGPAMADRIIEHRQTNGSFQSIEDIKNVKGIGEAKFAKMKDRLRV